MVYWQDKMGMPDISSYAQLRKHFDKAEPYRGSKDRPFGMRKYNNRRMRELPDRSIELEYMKHALVRWHPDGTVSVRAYDAQRNGGFDDEALPTQIKVGMGTRTGPVIYLFDTNKCDWWVTTPIPVAERDPQAPWRTENYARNDKIRVIKGKGWVHLKYDGATWVPVNEADISPITWFEPDRTRTRKASAEYNIPAFVNAAKAIIALGCEDMIGTDTKWRGLAYQETDKVDGLLAALKAEDFTTVLAAVRKAERHTYNKITGRWDVETKNISSTDVKALRDRVCVLAGLCDVKSERVITFEQYGRVERRLKDFGHPPTSVTA